MGNGNQVLHRICPSLNPKDLLNYRFCGPFLKFRIFTQIAFKTIDFVAFFFVGRVGSVGGSRRVIMFSIYKHHYTIDLPTWFCALNLA